jgi:hypothetical protein
MTDDLNVLALGSNCCGRPMEVDQDRTLGVTANITGGDLSDTSGPGSSVGTATGYGLDGPGIEYRWGARFSAPVQTGPGALPVSCTMGTGLSRE